MFGTASLEALLHNYCGRIHLAYMYTLTTQVYSYSVAAITLQLNTWVCSYLHPHDQAPPFKLRYATQITYIFLENPSVYQRRQTRIPVWSCSDLMYVFMRKNWQVVCANLYGIGENQVAKNLSHL